jgi:hypothetical protein
MNPSSMTGQDHDDYEEDLELLDLEDQIEDLLNEEEDEE